VLRPWLFQSGPISTADPCRSNSSVSPVVKPAYSRRGPSSRHNTDPPRDCGSTSDNHRTAARGSVPCRDGCFVVCSFSHSFSTNRWVNARCRKQAWIPKRMSACCDSDKAIRALTKFNEAAAQARSDCVRTIRLYVWIRHPESSGLTVRCAEGSGHSDVRWMRVDPRSILPIRETPTHSHFRRRGNPQSR
jgi:hypothetical protein